MLFHWFVLNQLSNSVSPQFLHITLKLKTAECTASGGKHKKIKRIIPPPIEMDAIQQTFFSPVTINPNLIVEHANNYEELNAYCAVPDANERAGCSTREEKGRDTRTENVI